MNGLKPNKINYIARLNQDRYQSAQSLYNNKFVLAIICLLAIIIAIEGYFLITMSLFIKPNIADIKAFTEDPASIAEFNQVQALNEQLQTLTGIRDNYQFAFKNINSYPEFTSTAYNTIIKAGQKNNVNLIYINYKREAGLLTIEGSTSGVLSCAAFVNSLRQSKVFGPVYYYGYSSKGENTAAQAGPTASEQNQAANWLTTLSSAFIPSVATVNEILQAQQINGPQQTLFTFSVICTLDPQEVQGNE
ncbi:MAG: hypothetical protein PHN35_03355 [Clostridia bacterium]|nr:hypothetical protein [Clostridia bacterium]